MDQESESNKCPICLDSFRCPKILPCKHTFCKRCISGFQKKNSSHDEFRCPLCRTLLVLPTEGANGFWDNYFIDDVFPDSVCDVCFAEEDEVGECETCNMYLCSFCVLKHVCSSPKTRKQKERILRRHFFMGEDDSDIEFESSSDESEMETNSVSSESDNEVPFELRQFGPTTIHKASPTGAGYELSQEGCISSIFSVSQFIIAFLTFGGNLCRYLDTRNGEVVDEIDLLEGSTDLCGGDDGTFYTLIRGCSVIFHTDTRNESTVVPIKNCDPLKICNFGKGQLLVLGKGKKGCIIGQILCPNGKELKTFNLHVDFSPNSIAMSKAGRAFCISYSEINFVDIRKKDGSLVKRYSGCFMENADEEFKPLSISGSTDGNFLILNESSNSIHIVSTKGDFIGLVELDNVESPLSIYVDYSDKIWIGERESCTIKAYEVVRFFNIFPKPENNIEALKLQNSMCSRRVYRRRPMSELLDSRGHNLFSHRNHRDRDRILLEEEGRRDRLRRLTLRDHLLFE